MINHKNTCTLQFTFVCTYTYYMILYDFIRRSRSLFEAACVNSRFRGSIGVEVQTLRSGVIYYMRLEAFRL